MQADHQASAAGLGYPGGQHRAGDSQAALGAYFPEWLLQRRRRAEQALVSVVATSYLLGVSTRRVEKLVAQMGIAGLSKSQVSEMAKSPDGQVEAFRSRPLDASPYTFLWLDALTQKVRENGRTVIVHALVAVGVTADGQREVRLSPLKTTHLNVLGRYEFQRDLIIANTREGLAADPTHRRVAVTTI